MDELSYKTAYTYTCVPYFYRKEAAAETAANWKIPSAKKFSISEPE